jgi:hypothetical protein
LREGSMKDLMEKGILLLAIRQAVYFFVNSLNAYIVPRRAFADEASYDGFVRRALEFQRPRA